MRSNFKFLPLLAAGALVWLGCESRSAPSGVYSAPASFVDRTTVVNFDGMPTVWPFVIPALQPPTGPVTDVNGSPVTEGYKINPNLFEPQVPGNVLQYPGSVQVVNNFKDFENAILTFEGYGANNTPRACHVSGAVTDLGNAKYPAVDLQIPMESGEKYNMGFFTGVKFYFKTGVADSASKRVFNIPTLQTQAPDAGNCDDSTKKCYDHFTASLSGTNGVWQQYSIKFTDLTRTGYGWPMNPSNLSGTNLQEVIWLQWEESNNNTQGIITIDFWVDEVEFFQ